MSRAQRGNPVRRLTDAQRLQQGRVYLGTGHVHQPGAGQVRALAEGCPGEAEANVVLDGEDPLNVLVDLRFVLLDPGQQGGGLTGQLLLAQLGVEPVKDAGLPPAEGVGPGAVVGGGDAGAGGLPILPPQIQPLSMAAHRQSGHLLGGDAGLLQYLPDTGAVFLPYLLHVPLLIPGPGGGDRGVPGGHRRLGAVQTEQGGLDHGTAIVHSHHILRHLSHSFLLKRSLQTLLVLYSGLRIWGEGFPA